MAMTERFLEEVKIGDIVDLIVGPKEAEGIVVYLDQEIVRVQKKNNTIATFSLSTINYFEVKSSDKTNVSERYTNNLLEKNITEKKDVAAESNKTIQEEPIEHNVLENAIISNNVLVIKNLLDDTDFLLSIGYTEEMLDRIKKTVGFSNYPKGPDYYNTAVRLNCFQGNHNRIAEKYFLRVINKSVFDKEQKFKAFKQLQTYYKNEKNYSDYLKLIEKDPKGSGLTDVTSFVFYAMSLDAMKVSNKDVLYKTNITFKSEGDYIYFFNYLIENPDSNLAEKNIRKFYLENKHIRASESVLQYILNNYSQQDFQKSRLAMVLNLYPEFTIEEMKGLLDVGYRVDEFIEEKSTEPETETKEVVQKIPRDPKTVIKEYLEDNQFGFARAYDFACRNNIDSESLMKYQQKLEEKFVSGWEKAVLKSSPEKLKDLLVFFIINGLSDEKLSAMKSLLREKEEAEIVKHLEKYDARIINSFFSDKNTLKILGYTEKEIERYSKLLSNKAFSLGSSDYEIASRLAIWGFLDNAKNYYIKVANNTHAEKRKNAINQLVVYATQTKDISLFEKYYPQLDEKQKNNEAFLKFMNECKYYQGDFEYLYNVYKKNTETNQKPVVCGALRNKDNKELRDELIEKVCQEGTFDYEFWTAYLPEVLSDSADDFRAILNKLLSEHVNKATRSVAGIYNLIKIDPVFSEEITEDLIWHATEEQYPVSLAMILCLNCKDDISETTKKVFEITTAKLNSAIEEMAYQSAYENGCFLQRIYPDNDELKRIVRVAANGIDIYNMLPSGGDNYAKGKRLMMLEEDSEKAFNCFKEEIKTSEDDRMIALCGIELLNGLLEKKMFSEVIVWGRILLVEKEIFGYTAISLNMNVAFSDPECEQQKPVFLKELFDLSEESIKNHDYKKAIERIKLIETFDKKHESVIKYAELLKKIEKENINLDDNTLMGQANILRYIEQDDEKYILFLKDAIKNQRVENDNKNIVATLLLETILLSGKNAENMDFIENFNSYKITLTEHIVDMLYTIVISNNDISSTIEYFSEVLEYAETEKKLSVLIRLEKLYEIALKENHSFDVSLSIKQMHSYIQLHSSLQARLCYIWLLAYSGNISDAKELISLIPDKEDLNNEQAEIMNNIISTYFEGIKPDLISAFEEFIRENTLLRFSEHCKKVKDFIVFSSNEEKVYAELVKGSSSVDTSSEVVRKAVAKTIYANPLKYKFWYIYLLCVKNMVFVEDTEYWLLLFCINVNLFLLNSDPVNSTPQKSVTYLLNNHSEIRDRYESYALYNQLYHMYLMKSFQKSPSILNKITRFVMDKKSFSKNPEIRQSLAQDYIQLFKLLDDKDDYIYVKSAMFVATNNKCEEYFYELFRKELLYREPALCVKMCIEMLVSNKSRSEFVNMVLSELANENPDYENVAEVLIYERNNITDICRLLQEYPNPPKEKHINTMLTKYKGNLYSSISILKSIDRCFPSSLIIKRKLLNQYRCDTNRLYYEDMYHIVLQILRFSTTEPDLYDKCRLAALLAASVGKSERMTDILNTYSRESLDSENSENLKRFCDICRSYDAVNDNKNILLFDALITSNWGVFFSKNGLQFVDEYENFVELIDFSKAFFVQNAFYNMYRQSLNNLEEDLNEFKICFDSVVQTVFGKTFMNVIDEYIDLPPKSKETLYQLIIANNRTNLFDSLPYDEPVCNLLIKIWDLVYGENETINLIITNKTGKNDAFDLLCAQALNYFKSIKLARMHIGRLYEISRDSKVIGLGSEYSWACEDLVFDTYYAASLLRSGNADAKAYVSKMSGEKYVNLIILLSKGAQEGIIRNIGYSIENKEEATRLILSIINAPQEEHLKEIDENYSGEVRNALLKLFYARIDNIELKNKLLAKYGDFVGENEYFIGWNTKRISLPNNLFDEETIDKIQNDESYLECEYVNEALKEVSLEKYTNGIPNGEKSLLLDTYENLGNDISKNPEYRKELLTQLIYVVSERNGDVAFYNECVIDLGMVLYYCNAETNPEKSRKILFETIGLLSSKTKNNTVDRIRKVACDLLNRFDSVEEITSEKNNLIKALNRILMVNRNKEYTDFFKDMKSDIEKISEVLLFSDVSQRAINYQNLFKHLETRRVKTSQQNFEKVYLKWCRILKAELKKLSNGVVVELEIETTRCSLRGKICGVVRNVGKKPAKSIKIRAVFEDAVRCKDNEKEINILYSGETDVFAFSIRCRDEGTHNFRIEMTYDDGQKTEQSSSVHEIKIAKVSNYQYIGNLYSVAPVTNNAEFYGREREKEEIFSFLNDVKYNTSMVMHGLKRVGKTSMLRYIERTLRDSDIYIPVYKSAQSVGENNAIGKMFVETVVDELDNLGLVDEKCRTFLEYDYNTNPEQLRDFYEYLQKSNLLGNKRILFMADEIEEIFDMVEDGFVNRRIYKTLRVILQELTSVRFIFCGADYLTDILRTHALADIFEITKRVVISRLDEDSMKKMLIEPATDKMTYTEKAIERIWHYTNGHTFYSKHICGQVIDMLNSESRTVAYAYDIDAAVKQVMGITEYFSYLSRFLDENDKQVIGLLCKNIKYSQDRISYNELKDQCEENALAAVINTYGRDETVLSSVLTDLEFKDIIETKEDDLTGTESYKFSIEMFRLWYTKENLY